MAIESIKNNFKRFGIGDNGDTVMPTLEANSNNIHSYYKANEVIFAYDHDFYNYQWSMISNNILDVLCTEYNSIIEKNGKDLFGNAEHQQTFDYVLRDEDFKKALKVLFDNYIISAINKYDLVNKLNLSAYKYTELKDANDSYDLEVGSIYEVICLTNTDVSGIVNPLYGIYAYKKDTQTYHTTPKAIFNENNATGTTKKDTKKLDSRLYFKILGTYLPDNNDRTLIINYSIWSNILDEARTYKPIDNSIDGVGISGRLMTDTKKRSMGNTTINFDVGGPIRSDNDYKLVFSQFRGPLETKTLDYLFIRKIG